VKARYLFVGQRVLQLDGMAAGEGTHRIFLVGTSSALSKPVVMILNKVAANTIVG
jgi:hypothetical protein